MHTGPPPQLQSHVSQALPIRCSSESFMPITVSICPSPSSLAHNCKDLLQVRIFNTSMFNMQYFRCLLLRINLVSCCHYVASQAHTFQMSMRHILPRTLHGHRALGLLGQGLCWCNCLDISREFSLLLSIIKGKRSNY